MHFFMKPIEKVYLLFSFSKTKNYFNSLLYICNNYFRTRTQFLRIH